MASFFVTVKRVLLRVIRSGQALASSLHAAIPATVIVPRENQHGIPGLKVGVSEDQLRLVILMEDDTNFMQVELPKEYALLVADTALDVIANTYDLELGELPPPAPPPTESIQEVLH